jgi:hypothetical protein
MRYALLVALALVIPATARDITRIGETPRDVRKLGSDRDDSRRRDTTPSRPSVTPRRTPPQSSQQQSSTVAAAEPETILTLDETPFREWTSSQGSTANARLLELTNVGAVLLTADGRRLSIGAEQLSQPDVDYLNATLWMAQAIGQAQQAQYFEDAIRTLETAIQKYRIAPQRSEAEALLAQTQRAFHNWRIKNGMVQVGGEWLTQADVQGRQLADIIQHASAAAPESGIRQLEDGLSRYPDAPNRSEALSLLAQHRDAVREASASRETASVETASRADDSGHSDASDDSDEGMGLGMWLMLWLGGTVVVYFIGLSDVAETVTSTITNREHQVTGHIETPTGRIIEGSAEAGMMLASLWFFGFPIVSLMVKFAN